MCKGTDQTALEIRVVLLIEAPKPPNRPVVRLAALKQQLVALAERMQEVGEAGSVQVGGVVGEQVGDERAEAQVEEERAAGRAGSGADLGDL